MIKGVVYPLGKTEQDAIDQVDPLFPNGNLDLARVECKGGRVVAVSNNARKVELTDNPIVIENKYGKGVVSFIPTIKYPAASELRQFYTFIIKAMFATSHKNCDVKVIARDTVIIKTEKDEVLITLEAMERKSVIV